MSEIINTFKRRFPEQTSTAQSVLEQHGVGEAYHPCQPPDIVFFPRSTSDVVAAVKMCAESSTPIVPFGGGTSIEGQVAAVDGGVCIDVRDMNSILSVRPEDLDCTVEPGVRRQQLNETLRDTGLFFPIDPGADATIGGMTSTRASGTNAVRYGTMKDAVVGLTVVTATGEIVKTAQRARKSSAGYDLTRLFVGSEGTLGVITEINLRLHGIPEAISGGRCVFNELSDAVDAVTLCIQSQLPVARLELLDELQMRAINRYAKLELPEKSSLFFEFHGTPDAVNESAVRFQDIVEDCGGGGFVSETDPDRRNEIWKARHAAYYAAKALMPGCTGFATDVCVPISNLSQCVVETKQDITEMGLTAPIVGHVGDGNFHVLCLFKEGDTDELHRIERFNEKLVKRALAFEGTCTGEHGIGTGKMKYLEMEIGAAVPLMRQIKAALDPQGIMNPGKIFAA
ncbi:MAG: FAD-linked oxidase C-terminal domain-containing protein [Pseudomonadota bacterium]